MSSEIGPHTSVLDIQPRDDDAESVIWARRVWDLEHQLTPEQASFASHFAATGDAVESHMLAYSHQSERRGIGESARLLGHPTVCALIDELSCGQGFTAALFVRRAILNLDRIQLDSDASRRDRIEASKALLQYAAGMGRNVSLQDDGTPKEEKRRGLSPSTLKKIREALGITAKTPEDL